MTRSAYPLKLPESIKQAAQRLAKEDGVSLNQWISAAVARKVGASEAALEYLAREARPDARDRLRHYLDNAPDQPPLPGDELPG
jgi:hypothetical protein